MRRFTVTIEYNNGRENHMTVWDDNAEEAIARAMK